MITLWTACAFAGSLDGFVFDGVTGAPVAGAEVEVDSQPVATGPDGRFRFTVAGGVHVVRIGQASVEVLVADDGTSEVLATLNDEGTTFQVEQPVGDLAGPVEVALSTVTGRIRDAQGLPLAEARVFVVGGGTLVRSDADGFFSLSAAEGAAIDIVAPGYETARVTVTTAGAELSVVLAEARMALATYTVRAPYLEGTVAGLLDDRKEGSAVADVLGADEMTRAGDSDAASALSRVTGLSVVDGKYVFVRGLGDRYSSSLLDGAVLPSPEPERRVVPLDLFPTSVLSGVVVQKTWSPDMPGEFGGGVIQLETVQPPSGLTAGISLSGAYRQGTTFGNGLTSPGRGLDLLGVDGGHRALPADIAAASSDSPLEPGDRFSDRGYSADELEKFGELLSTEWSPVLRSLPPGFGLSAHLGSGGENADLAGGWLAALTFGNDWQTERFERTYYVPDATGLRSQHRYQFDQTTNTVNLGAFLTGGVDVGRSALRYAGMLSRSTDDTARIYEGYNDDVGSDIRVSRLRWVERQVFWHRVGGEHRFEHWDVDWHGVLARATRLEPDRRETRYDNEPGTTSWSLSDRPEGNGRLFSNGAELELEGALDVRWFPRRDADEDGPMLAFGGRVTRRARDVDTRRFKFFHKGGPSRDADVLSQDPEAIFVPENIRPDGFQLEEFTRATDNYTASHNLFAGYVDTRLPLGRVVSVTAGARLEQSAQRVETFELFNPDQVPVPADLTRLDVLPAATVTLAPLESVRVRLGGARTVSRPDFRELSPATFNDVTGGRQTFGNPDLDRARIDHGDLRVEWFPRPAEVLSIGVFAKRFVGPVETVVVPSAQQSVTWQNAESGTNLGLELEARRQFPANLWAAGNLALIRSRVTLGEGTGIQTSDERRLQGQSPFVANLQGGWEHPTQGQVTVLLNVVGPRITEVGARGAPDVLTSTDPQLDIVGRKTLGRGWSTSLKLQNLLNPAPPTVQGDSVIDAVRVGWRASVGIGWKIE